MKSSFILFYPLLLCLLIFPAVSACSLFETPLEMEKSYLSLEFSDDSYFETKTKLELPDTNDFILSVSDAAGKSVYKGVYGDSPEKLEVAPGSYTVKVSSGEMKAPAFDRPLFGDEQCVVVKAGQNCRVQLMCRQVNCGVKLKIDKNFLTAYPSSALLLKSQEGSLLYSYSERRTAYFNPGTINLILSGNASDEKIYTKELKAREMLELTVRVSSGNTGTQAEQTNPSAVFKMEIDSARVWYKEFFTIGGGGSSSGGESSSEALTIARAKDRIGDKGVWVTGYIVGGDLSSSSMSFELPFKSKTNLAIGPRSSTDDKSSCLSVSLPAGSIRDALNLVDNSHLFGKRVILRGDIVESYFGIPGLKNVNEYVLK